MGSALEGNSCLKEDLYVSWGLLQRNKEFARESRQVRPPSAQLSCVGCAHGRAGAVPPATPMQRVAARPALLVMG